MFFADELAFWVGDTPEVSDLPDGTTFGVSLTDIGGSSLDADPVIAGELWFDNKVIQTSLCVVRGSGREMPLTQREAEILRFICEGYSNKAIAETLNISEQTVKTHCNHLFKKFEVTSRLKLALRATSSP